MIIIEGAFEKSKHKFKYYRDNETQIELIDNKQYWGTDGELPKTQYKNITVKIGKSVFALPKSALENLYEVNLDSTETYFDKDRNIIYIISSNSDGAGYYEVIWKIEKATYKDRLVAHGF